MPLNLTSKPGCVNLSFILLQNSAGGLLSINTNKGGKCMSNPKAKIFKANICLPKKSLN